MSRRLVLTILLSTCLVVGLVASSGAIESIETRKDIRENANVEVGDRGDKRREVREATDPGDRSEAREAAGVEVGDRRGKRKEAREAIR